MKRFDRQRPQILLRLTARKFVERQSAPALDGVARDIRQIQKESGSRAALDALLRRIGVELPPERDEGYYAEALNFQLGMVEACAGRPEAMAELMRLSNSMPSPEDECLFSDHAAIAQITREHQLHGIARGIPAILFACMPRSASATLTQTLAEVLDVPVPHVCLGEFPDNYYLVPSWLNTFLEGGAITQDHFMLSAFNRGVLSARGPRDIFVTVRDPRAAARSHVHMRAAGGYRVTAPLEQRIERDCVSDFIPWLQSWIECARDATLPFRIHMIKFADITGNLAGTVRQIARTLQDAHPAMAPYAQCRDVEEVRVHFEQGDDAAWRSEVGASAGARMWDACTPDIRALLDLRP